jgi:hypothetical protein
VLEQRKYLQHHDPRQRNYITQDLAVLFCRLPQPNSIALPKFKFNTYSKPKDCEYLKVDASEPAIVRLVQENLLREPT